MGAIASTISTGMSEIQYAANAGGDGKYTERSLEWAGGGILSKRRNTSLPSEGRLLNDRFAIGFGFQGGDGECEWVTDGKPVLARLPDPSIDFRDLVVLPSGCEFRGVARGLGECVWLFVADTIVEERGIGKSIASQPAVDSNWSRDRLLWTLIAELREECRHGFPRGALFAETASLAFVAQLECYLRGREAPLTPSGALRHDKVCMVIDFVEANIGRRVALSELSALVDLSAVHFCRAFKEATGHSPHQFVIERQVDRAKGLLAGSTMTLAEIALASGFAHQSHLCYHFRRVVGASPGRYRREMADCRRRSH
jgi:AraC family transcriptional regulator